MIFLGIQNCDVEFRYTMIHHAEGKGRGLGRSYKILQAKQSWFLEGGSSRKIVNKKVIASQLCFSLILKACCKHSP